MNARLLSLAGAFGAGFAVALLILFVFVLAGRPRSPGSAETTDVGQTMLMQLDESLEWHRSGPTGDGLSLWGPIDPATGAHPPAVLSVLPDGADPDRCRVYLYGADVSARLSAGDHAELRKVLERRREMGKGAD